ncbi:HET-domain-containing protein [Hypoxylon sp. NC1633]|nr:HET-domain-containing protein [Hypoxylon sp. NC1633]
MPYLRVQAGADAGIPRRPESDKRTWAAWVSRNSTNSPQLSYDIEEAVAADRAGCPLFHAFIDNIKKNTRLGNSLILTLRYEKEDLPYFPANLVLIVTDDETRKADVQPRNKVSSLYGLLIIEPSDDAASIDITTRPYELDYASTASVEFARNCIQSCQLNHEERRRPVGNMMARQWLTSIDLNSIPSRLLHLVTKDSGLHVKLIGHGLPVATPKETVSSVGFAILSYCWGGPQPVHDVPISKLPKSIHDAAWLTHEFGLNYLRIDALCIFQDDARDKVHEISHCSDGFLMSREEDSTDYSIGPIQLRARTSSGAFGYVPGLAESDDFNLRRSQEPLTLRGWTLQESLLSRRVLIFPSRHLYFIFTVANAGCGDLEPLLKLRVMTSYEPRVVDYTTRHLGFVADKLPAVSVLASSLIPTARERNQKLVYIAGIAIDTSDAEKKLLATRTSLGVYQVQSAYRIPTGSPTWSWSSVHGRIIPWRRSQPSQCSNTDKIQLCEYKVELENKIAPFSSVKGGFIRIHATTKCLDTITGLNYTITTEYHLLEGTRTVDRGIQGEEHVSLVELIPFYEKTSSPAGLIVAKLHGTDSYEMTSTRTLFDGAPSQKICIV